MAEIATLCGCFELLPFVHNHSALVPNLLTQGPMDDAVFETEDSPQRLVAFAASQRSIAKESAR
jgi:hypothetical protein